MTNYTLTFPDDFDDYEWEVRSKGWFGDAKLKLLGKEYRLNFYDPVRLGQEIESELHRRTAFFEPNLVVIPGRFAIVHTHPADLKALLSRLEA